VDDIVAADTRLPVPMSPYGPLHGLAVEVHELTQTSRCEEALALLDRYEPFARAFGDEKTLGFLLQGRLYAYAGHGRIHEAMAAGERLVSHYEAAGAGVPIAKALADLAQMYLNADRVSDAVRCLARAELMLDRTSARDDRYVAALGSLMSSAAAAELYETAYKVYQRISELWRSSGRPDTAASYDMIYAEILLYWGLQLHQLGEQVEALNRLSTAAEIVDRWCTGYAARGEAHAALQFNAMHAVVLERLGEVDRAAELAAGTVLALRAQGDWEAARLAHLAWGIALRAQGDLVAARRELRAAQELESFGSFPALQLIVGFELASLAAEELGETASRDSRRMIDDQARRLWRVRLQRVAMVREVRLREEQEEARRRAEAALLHDPLTGLGNRRRYEQLMSDVDLDRLPGPTVLLVIDVDEFKAINDTYSHSAGDEVLREIGAVLQANCRAQDVPIRYAGDEFAVFLNTDLAGARHVAERICSAVRDATFDHVAPGLRVSLSIGVAAHCGGSSAHELFHAADMNLYQEKRGGRDRVVA
jgi:diguanylate cyclase (GGDEF)-like protein